MNMSTNRTWRLLRQYFLTGFFALLPVAITVYIGYRIFQFFNGVSALLPSGLQNKIPGLGIIITVIFVTLFGLLVSNILGQQFVKILEWFFARVPVIRSIYDGSKQILKTFFNQKEGARFKRVVFVPYPDPISRAIGFVVNEGVSGDRVGVFIPFSPPTGGYLLFFHGRDVESTDLTVDDAMKMLLSGGTLAPRRSENPEEGEAVSGE